MNTHVRVLLFTLGLPVLAVIFSWACMAKLDVSLREQVAKEYSSSITQEQLDNLTVSSLAERGAFRAEADLPVVYRHLKAVRNGAAVTAVAGLLLFGGIFVAGRATRTRRDLLLKLFRPGLYLTLTAVGILTAAQALEIAYSAYYFESIFIEHVHLILIGGIAIGGVLALVAVARAMFSLLKAVKFEALGAAVSRAEQPGLWAVVDDVCGQLETRAPDNIILGLEPTFYVTESPVTCSSGIVTGRTLFISLSLSRVLLPAELRSVIGHEMAHFIGEDTVFSQRFFPVYRGTLVALHNLRRNAVHGSVAIAQLPAVMFLAFFFDSFVVSEKNLSRIRETEADGVGARVGGASALATALVKVHAYHEPWGKVFNGVRHNEEEYRAEENLSRPFVAHARAVSAETLSKVGEKHLFHPTDSHPALSVRLQALQTDLASVVPQTRVPDVEESAAAVITGLDGLELTQSKELRRKLQPV